jgi:menaquinone-dependent protoporphyrinogen oxidase
VSPKRVLVAFSSRSGSTAVVAEEIAAVLRTAGYLVDCRPKEDVADIVPYRAVILGSGMYVASRASDGGGFLERYAGALSDTDVWLFSAGPIGGRPALDGAESAVATVARMIGARGVAAFGAVEQRAGEHAVGSLPPTDRRSIRAWATGIAVQLDSSAPRSHGRDNLCGGRVPAG